jgi:hypothetical protein
VKTRLLAMVAEGSWLGDQMKRLAEGLDADPSISATGSAIRYLLAEPARGLLHRITYRAPSVRGVRRRS